MAFSFIVVSEEFNSNVTAFLILPLANAFVTGSSAAQQVLRNERPRSVSVFSSLQFVQGFFHYVCFLMVKGEQQEQIPLS